MSKVQFVYGILLWKKITEMKKKWFFHLMLLCFKWGFNTIFKNDWLPLVQITCTFYQQSYKKIRKLPEMWLIKNVDLDRFWEYFSNQSFINQIYLHTLRYLHPKNSCIPSYGREKTSYPFENQDYVLQMSCLQSLKMFSAIQIQKYWNSSQIWNGRKCSQESNSTITV